MAARRKKTGTQYSEQSPGGTPESHEQKHTVIVLCWVKNNGDGHVHMYSRTGKASGRKGPRKRFSTVSFSFKRQ